MHDIEEYYRAGTLTTGLIKATAEAGIDAKQSAAQKVAVIRNQALPGTINDVNQPLVPQDQLIITGPTRLTSLEESLSPALIREIQTALCLPSPTDDFGPINSPARLAMSDFFTGADLDPSQVIRNDAMLNLLSAAVAKVKVRKKGTCSSAKLADARAVGASLKK